jgi:hypothetical protein
MKERPILFKGPMVRALLAGTKTQTRRVVKGIALEWLRPNGFTPEFTAAPENGLCPYGQPGDRLWVRETWQRAGGNTGYWYRATDSKADDGGSPVSHWRPSIFMPRGASRITLEVTGVRVERLQDISRDDALAEGIVSAGDGNGFQLADTTHYSGNPIDSYFSLWEHINGPGSVEANPWVWVVEWPALLNTERSGAERPTGAPSSVAFSQDTNT